VIENTASFKGKRIRLMAGDRDPAHPRPVEERTVACLRGWGADAALVWLPERGHSGNGHYIMGENNSDEILAIFVEQAAYIAGGTTRKQERTCD